MTARLRWYVGGVLALAAILLLALVPALNPGQLPQYALWLAFCFAAEQLWLSSITGGGYHSMVSTFNFAVITLLPMPAAVWIVSLSAMLAAFLFQRRVWYRALFNGAQMVPTTLAASYAFHLLGGSFSQAGELLSLRFLGPWMLAVLIYHGMNTGLVAGAIALQAQEPYRKVWRENFGYRDELMSSGALFLMSPIAITAYLAIGFWGLVLFYVPLLFIRDAHSRHIALVRAQEALIFRERMAAKGDIAAKIAHDLDNFLAPIMARAQMLMLNPGSDAEKVARYAQIIFENVANMKILTKSLSSFSWAEVQIVGASLNEVVTRTVEFLKPQNKFEPLSFDLQLDPHLPLVPLDPAQMQHVLMNLLSNSADALREAETSAPCVEIRTALAEGGRSVALTVRDNGPGIPAEHLSRIFEPRFTTKGIKGSGFGLASCFNIVQNHGGRIRVSSPAGGGASFEILLPARTQATP